MQTIIKWNKTSECLPEQQIINHGKNAKTGEDILSYVDNECLVIWEGKVKRSRYLTNQKRWEGHLKEQVPEYWVKIKDLEI